MRRPLLGALALFGALTLTDAGALAAPPKAKAKATKPIVLPSAKKPPAKTTPKETKPATKGPDKPDTAPVTESANAPGGELRGPTRIDFDDRLIQGQTNKSGAVYLFDRKETGISSMVRRRKSFRQLTIGTIYDR